MVEKIKSSSLPVSEFVHPAPLAALALLALNDHVLKGSGILPGAVTGKLSDFAGLVFFPLLLTALADTLALALNRLAAAANLGLRLDASLRRWKLIAATAATALAFGSIQLFPEAVRIYTSATAALGFPSTVRMDPTDLMALPALIVPYLVGMSRLGSTRGRAPFFRRREQTVGRRCPTA